MKRAYKTPKAKMIDFTYDVQVSATSDGDMGWIGDPNDVGVCQQRSATACLRFWTSAFPGTTCREEPSDWSLRP